MSEILGTLFKYLISLLGVAAVVLILYQVFGANKTQNAISDATLLATNTQALYNAQSSFSTITNTVATNGKLAPPGMLTGTVTTLVNPWGGAVTIAASSPVTNFDITETGVPIDACAKMISGLSSAVGLTINGTTIAPATLPMDAGTAVTACNAGAVAGLSTLTFTFGK